MLVSIAMEQASFKFSLTLDEDADIFTITGENFKWEGKLCRIPRTAIQKQHTSLKEFQQAGVYFLIGEEKGCLKAYVGQAGRRSKDKTFIKRMEEHDDKKDWFKEVFFLTINTDYFKQDLDNAQLDYLELEFYNRVPEEIRTNANKPQETYMTRDRENNLNELIKPVPLLMKVLGRDIFNIPQSPPPSKRVIETPPPPPPTGEMVLFHRLSQTVNKTYHVVAFYEKDEASEHYTVLKGSTIAPWNANDETRKESGILKYLCAMREKWAKSPTLTLTEDVPSFNSPSQAAMFVTGNKSAQGKVWEPVTEEDYRKFLEKVPPSQLIHTDSLWDSIENMAEEYKEEKPANEEEHLGRTLPPPPNPNIFRLNDKQIGRYKVQAYFNVPSIGSKKTIVLAGSVIALPQEEYPSYMTLKDQRKMRELREKHLGQPFITLEENIEFDNSAAAVRFVVGCHKGGPNNMIRMTDGKTLAEITKTLRDAQKQAKGKESLS
ncbi:MAG: hypothetical protein LUE08_01640 [Akkermansiaceae bacterium]|nr:hypothetical protein [Akkermansiaceae bacterium]